ncbi:CRISPR-associated endonuclease Cas9 [Lactococcus insecticola]|uniref:CRISPR-associated endonuclease Cas9 n=2 Tax=Pseudolactococcus insecticola TaxID=2709158 RepID=A0A6A0B492_9LACT|nr:CRISPR-associated endonuclease Cas9 [Lactococcus insecticola]
MLREIFSDDILKFDDSFFIRMDESFYQNDDNQEVHTFRDANGHKIEKVNKSVKTPYPLFNGKIGQGETYANEVDYYKAYPTIYHLRERLVNDKSQADLRLVYLALHHILKFRGHFTNQGQKFDLKNINVAESLQELLEKYQAVTTFDFNFDEDNEAAANQILTNRNISKSKKAYDLTELYSVLTDENYAKHEDQGKKFLETKNAQQKALFTAIVGNSIDLAKIFSNDEYKPTEENGLPKGGDFKYGNENFDEKLADIENAISPEEFEVIAIGKKVYEAIVLSGILTKETLAASMVEKYDDHKEQLAKLKQFIKKYLPDEEYKIFFNAIPKEVKKGQEKVIEGTYVGYVGLPKAFAKTKQRTDKKPFSKKYATREMFYSYVKNLLFQVISDEITKKNIILYDNKGKKKELSNSGNGQNFNIEFLEVNKSENKENYNKFDSDKITFVMDVLQHIELENYLPKQRQSDNGAIPYQVHEHELRRILKNQGQYYPFLLEQVDVEEENEAGDVSIKQEYKIQVLFKFRIPYYVGTLAKEAGWARGENGELVQTNSSSKNSWLVRQSDEKLTPWNFDQVVDKEASAVNFIERMTNFDTYLPSEKVLPKNSLLYQEFSIYNELIIGGYYQDSQKNYFSPETRQMIVEKLFKKNKSVTAQKMIDCLNCELNLNLSSAKELFGIDTFVKSPKYNTSYSTYIDLVKAGISEQTISDNPDIFEQIIKWQTIFEDKKVLKKTIKNANENDWGHLLTEEQVKKLGSRHYTGWGRLSKKLLDGLKAENGKTIIENLKEENYNNFMRLLEDKKIAAAIKSEQVEKLDDTTLNYGMVENLAGSPAIKKGIWQSLQIIKELENYLGRENIGKIVVEMARGSEPGRKKTRQRQIEDFYKKFAEKTGQDVASGVRNEFENISDAHRFDDEKVFLYFLQNGKSMYGGANLDLDNLSAYEIDHIVPQTYIKDDSFDNKVLVLKSENQNKGGDVPSQAIISKMRDYWELLAKNGQVSPRKLANLKIGKLSDERKSGFVNRQLVETRQITKHVANILSDYFKSDKVEVLTPKAGLTSQFRHGEVFVPVADFDFETAKAQHVHYEYDNKAVLANGEVIDTKYSDSNFVKVYVHDGFPKNRDLNDYHHAHDAYLNAIVAIYIYETRPDLHDMWVYGDYQRKAQQVTGKYGKQRKDYYKQLLSDMTEESWMRYVTDEDGKTIYQSGEFWHRDEVISKIKKNLSLRNVNIVKKTEEQTGKFGDTSVYKRDETAKNFATGLKQNLNPNKYGGTKKPISAFAVIIKDVKGNIKPLSIPAMLVYDYAKAPDKLKFIQDIYQSESISEILVKKIVKYNKYLLENGAPRMFSSYQEAMSGSQLPMINIAGKSASTEDMLKTYDQLAMFIKKNKLFADGFDAKGKYKEKSDKVRLLDSDIRDYFIANDSEVKTAIISEMLKVISPSESSQGLKALQQAGLGTTAQQLTGSNAIGNNATLIYQSITGLYETRKKLKWDGE